MSDLPINQVVCADCMDVLPKLPSDSINTVLTDPPFFLPSTHYVTRDKSWGKKYSDLSVIETTFKQVFKECQRILKWNGHLLVHCDSVSYVPFFRCAYPLFDFTRCLVWYKGKNYFSLGKGAWRYSFELILHARNSDAYFLKLDLQDVVTHPVVNSQDRLHPAEKPVGLLKELIIACTPKNGSVVLDPFLGSGSTAVACKELGMNYIGIELDEGYAEIARQRITKTPSYPTKPLSEPSLGAYA